MVSPEIDEEAYEELKILCNLHGIGFILLDIENLSQSEILILSTQERELDWDNINRIREAENTDFEKYIQLVDEFQKTGQPHEYQWDIPKK